MGYKMKSWEDMSKEELEQLKKETEEFEAGFPDGVYAIAPKKGETRINVPALFKYCRKHGKDPEKLTQEELKQFYDGTY
jgi:hypothetical protein